MVGESGSSFKPSHSRLRIRHKCSLSPSICGATLYPDLVRARWSNIPAHRAIHPVMTGQSRSTPLPSRGKMVRAISRRGGTALKLHLHHCACVRVRERCQGNASSRPTFHGRAVTSPTVTLSQASGKNMSVHCSRSRSPTLNSRVGNGGVRGVLTVYHHSRCRCGSKNCSARGIAIANRAKKRNLFAHREDAISAAVGRKYIHSFFVGKTTGERKSPPTSEIDAATSDTPRRRPRHYALLRGCNPHWPATPHLPPPLNIGCDS